LALACRLDRQAYDCFYATLAAPLECLLVTDDRRILQILARSDSLLQTPDQRRALRS
jgi:predicted nucleic acid-binding protein